MKLVKVKKTDIDFDSNEYKNYRKFIVQSYKEFSKFGTRIFVSLVERDMLVDNTPVAELNVSATGGMTEKQLDEFVTEFNKAYKFIKEREKEAQKLYKSLNR